MGFLPAGRLTLSADRDLGRHHLFPVNPAAVDNEGPVANGMKRALLLARGIDVCGKRLEHDNVVLLDDVRDPALDVGEAFPDQGRPDDSSRNGRELEPGELVGVGSGAHPYTDHLIEHVNRRNGNDARFVLPQRRERIVPFARGDGKYRRKIQHHGPGDRHDVVFLPIMGRDEYNRPRFHQRKGLAQLQLTHGSTSWYLSGGRPGARARTRCRTAPDAVLISRQSNAKFQPFKAAPPWQSNAATGSVFFFYSNAS